MKRKTRFDRYLDAQMKDPEFRTAYEAARARVDAIDSLVRELDRIRTEQHLTKAELARRVGVEPAAIRRLFSSETPNPTVSTLVNVAMALGLELKLASVT